jgi:hypothetical protein
MTMIILIYSRFNYGAAAAAAATAAIVVIFPLIVAVLHAFMCVHTRPIDRRIIVRKT